VSHVRFAALQGKLTSRLIGTAVVLVGLATATCRPPAQPTIRPQAGLAIACEPQDATLFIDDRYVGVVARLGQLVLPEGLHRLELRRDGYFAHFAEVTLVKGVRQKLAVKLRREPF
jgi:hypothetical protein